MTNIPAASASLSTHVHILPLSLHCFGNGARFGGEPRTRDLWFSPNQSTAEQQEHAKAPRDDETVVFRLFGKSSSTPSYALHDEDVLEWLHTLLTETAR